MFVSSFISKIPSKKTRNEYIAHEYVKFCYDVESKKSDITNQKNLSKKKKIMMRKNTRKKKEK